MPASTVEYATPDGAVCAAGFAALKSSRLYLWMLANVDKILLLPHDRNNLEGVILAAGMRSWGRTAKWMVGHTGGIVGYMYVAWDAVAKIALAPFLKGAERKEAVQTMSESFPFSVPVWVLDAADACIAAEVAKRQSRIAGRVAAATRALAGSHVVPEAPVEEDPSGRDSTAPDNDDDDASMLLVPDSPGDTLMSPPSVEQLDNQARVEQIVTWDDSDDAQRALFQSPLRVTSRMAALGDRMIVYKADLGEVDQVVAPVVFSARSAHISSSSDDCIVSLVDGSTAAEVVLPDADSALQVRRYVALWLDRRLVGQCLPLRPGLDMAPATPAWLHPDIQITHGWFGFLDGVGDVHWVPWSIIRSALATAEAMSVIVSTNSNASWNFSCPSFGNATAVAKIITGCSRLPVVERTLHTGIRIMEETLCLTCGDAGETAAQLSLNWQSISAVRVEVDLLLSISVVDSSEVVVVPGESRIFSFSFPDEAAVALATAWMEWWWKLRPLLIGQARPYATWLWSRWY